MFIRAALSCSNLFCYLFFTTQTHTPTYICGYTHKIYTQSTAVATEPNEKKSFGYLLTLVSSYTFPILYLNTTHNTIHITIDIHIVYIQLSTQTQNQSIIFLLQNNNSTPKTIHSFVCTPSDFVRQNHKYDDVMETTITTHEKYNKKHTE